MNINEFNLILSLIWILVIYFIFGFENTLKSLIFSEFLWITLFFFYLINALIFDDINILSFTLFFFNFISYWNINRTYYNNFTKKII